MTSSITEYIIALLELVEAEVLTLKQGLKRLIMTLVLLMLALFMLLIAVIFAVYGAYQYCLTFMSPVLASLTITATLVGFALALIGYVKWKR